MQVGLCVHVSSITQVPPIHCGAIAVQQAGLRVQIGDKINQRGAQSGSLREVYRKFDEDKSGKVDFRELRNGAVLIVVLTPFILPMLRNNGGGGWLVGGDKSRNGPQAAVLQVAFPAQWSRRP